jgi:ribonuclease J
MTDREHPIHVSGHPAQDELAQMYHWVQPRIAIPVHGEARHLAAHAELARACQVPEAIVAENGALIRLAPGRAEILEKVQAGRLVLDGNRLISANSPTLRGRQKIAYNGSAVVSLVMDGAGSLLAEPRATVQGLLDPENDRDVLDAALESVEDELDRLPRRARADDARVRETARVALRRSLFRSVGKKPVTEVHLIRL